MGDDILPDGKLPGDVMVRILTNLPVKSLLKFRAVSKSWCCLISSNRFFKHHLDRQSVVAPNNCILLLVSVDDYEDENIVKNEKLGLLDLTHHYYYYDSLSPPAAPADDDVLFLVDDIPRRFDYPVLLDSCNGLVCMTASFEDSCHLILWNPATRRYRSIYYPEREGGLLSHTLALCYVDSTNDFKILVWSHISPSSPVDLYLYSSLSNLWDIQEIYASTTKIEFESPTFMGTYMHWLSQRRPNGSDSTSTPATEIVAFDVINMAVSWFHLPVSRRVEDIIVIGGCLSIVVSSKAADGDDVDARKSGYVVWVMEKYGVEGSWVKRYFFQAEEECSFFRDSMVSWNDAEIVFNQENIDDSKVMVFHDPYSGKKRYVEFSSHHVLKFLKYVESLAPVGELDSCDEQGDC